MRSARAVGLLGCLLLWWIPALAQLPEIDATTPEGELLAKVGLAEDPAEKLASLMEFASKYPDHLAIGWVLAQQVQSHATSQQHNQVLATAAKLFALDVAKAGLTNRVRASAAAVKSAEELGKREAIVEWARRSHESATAIKTAPTPEETEEEAWAAEKTYALQVAQYADYVHLRKALDSTDAAEVAAYASALKSMNASSEYLPGLLERQFVVGRAANNREVAVPAAEALTAMDKGNDETLLYLASVYLETKQNQDKIVPYTDAALEKLKTKTAPEGMDAAEFKKQLDFSTGLAHWVQGLYHATGSRWAQANKSLRAALPNIGGNQAMQAAAYFYLGVANFEIGKKSKDHKEIIDAVKFTELCTKMNSPYQAQAKQNLIAIRGQFRM
ncbi:MAG: hypothetical protein MUF01_02075 [Bryobacterales bacterium]|jgi:hypothetical protein|nr:hypothetical protein [Bryobacterales bacterium]